MKLSKKEIEHLIDTFRIDRQFLLPRRRQIELLIKLGQALEETETESEMNGAPRAFEFDGFLVEASRDEGGCAVLHLSDSDGPQDEMVGPLRVFFWGQPVFDSDSFDSGAGEEHPGRSIQWPDLDEQLVGVCLAHGVPLDRIDAIRGDFNELCDNLRTDKHVEDATVEEVMELLDEPRR